MEATVYTNLSNIEASKTIKAKLKRELKKLIYQTGRIFFGDVYTDASLDKDVDLDYLIKWGVVTINT